MGGYDDDAGIQESVIFYDTDVGYETQELWI
jgi:hypothetical protein